MLSKCQWGFRICDIESGSNSYMLSCLGDRPPHRFLPLGFLHFLGYLHHWRHFPVFLPFAFVFFPFFAPRFAPRFAAFPARRAGFFFLATRRRGRSSAPLTWTR